jgi:hypothetical protein
MKRLLIVTAAVFVLASPAMARMCPTLVKQIDEKLATAQLSDEDKAKVTELRNSGEKAHQDGKHDEAETDLNAALAILNK